MIKTHIKHYLIITLLICFTFCSISAVPINTSSVDNTLNDSFISLTNIQKQLKSLVKDVYLSEPDSTYNKDFLKQLNVFSTQTKDIREPLEQISPSEVNTKQSDKLRYLLTITSFLNYIEIKMSALASTSDEFERYDLLQSIFLTNYLLDVIIAYTD